MVDQTAENKLTKADLNSQDNTIVFAKRKSQHSHSRSINSYLSSGSFNTNSRSANKLNY